MVERSAQAFGEYLRALRERKGFSLGEVVDLSRNLPDRLTKSYLSRCENGQQRIAFSRILSLSRIYDVPPEVLHEKMEMDLELDRVEAPDVKGLGFYEIFDKARDVYNAGNQTLCYAYLVAFWTLARNDPSLQDDADVQFEANLALIAAADMLGRNRVAEHEINHMIATGGLEHPLGYVLYERMAQVEATYGRLDNALKYSSQAIRNAFRSSDDRYLSLVLCRRAYLHQQRGELRRAIRWSLKAIEILKKDSDKRGLARELLNLASRYHEQGRLQAAKRTLTTCEALATEVGRTRSLILAKILRAEMNIADGCAARAIALLHEAADMARSLNDPVSRFQALHRLLRVHLNHGELNLAQSLKRQIDRILPLVPRTTEELPEYFELSRHLP